MFRKILVPLDGSDLAEEAIGRAAAIARGSKAAIDLVLVHEPVFFGGQDDPTWNEKQIVREHDYLREIASELESGVGVKTTYAVKHGDPIVHICARARDIGADLIVMTSHGRTGWSRVWIGSVADAVVRQSPVPVMMFRPAESRQDRRAMRHLFKKILVPLDGSAVAQEILGPASELAQCSKASVALLRVVTPVYLATAVIVPPFTWTPMMADDAATEVLVALAHGELDAAESRLTHEGVEVVEKGVIVSPNVPAAISEFAAGHGVDALALSTHGRGASRLLIGSVADKVRRNVDVPVLLQRPRNVRQGTVTLTEPAVVEQLPALAGT